MFFTKDLLAPYSLRKMWDAATSLCYSLKAMKTVSAVAFILLSSQLFGQSPLIFVVNKALIGSTPTLTFDAVGRWSPDKESSGSPLIGPMSARVRCFKSLGFCERVGVVVAAGPVTGALLQDFNITKWDDHEITAVDNTAPCVVSTLRIKFRVKTVAQDKKLKSPGNDPSCKEFTHLDEGTSFLVGISGETTNKN